MPSDAIMGTCRLIARLMTSRRPGFLGVTVPEVFDGACVSAAMVAESLRVLSAARC
jgi:hypothetical protein